MFRVWIKLCLLLPGVSSFMIHNTLHSLCLEDFPKTGLVQLNKCNLDSVLQQWIWRDQSLLERVGTSRCLSAHHSDPVQTVPCEGVEDGGLRWGCELNRLISLNSSLELSTDGNRLTLSHRSKQTKWRSLDEGDICQERLRSKRASSDPDEFEVKPAEEQKAGPPGMTDEQKEFLRWFYRTEDPTPWKFAMLALSFAALLLGCLLLGMGSMANKNRNKIAKYKAAALAMKPEAEELQVIVTEVGGQRTNSEVKPINSASVQVSMSQSEIPVSQAKPLQDNGEVEGLKPGDIVVTWTDGNVSSLYPEPEGEVEVLAEVEKEEVLKKEEVVEVEKEEVVEEVEKEEVVEEVEKEGAEEGVVVEG
ncbi:solute carrier family 51 subunit beta [Oncorhynchus masou masou]|uniref:solute carrier family 51 subunit beta n=1 Tax=Oncorhynchus masou masou TaxID=90313 RepID=UPI003183E5AD